MISCACITTPRPCRCVRCFTAADGDASCDARAQNLGSHPRGAELWGMGCYGSKCGHPKIRKVQKIQRPLPLIVTHNQSIPKMFGGSVYHLRPCVFSVLNLPTNMVPRSRENVCFWNFNHEHLTTFLTWTNFPQYLLFGCLVIVHGSCNMTVSLGIASNCARRDLSFCCFMEQLTRH